MSGSGGMLAAYRGASQARFGRRRGAAYHLAEAGSPRDARASAALRPVGPHTQAQYCQHGGKRIMLMKAALNGSRTPMEHPAIPVTPAQLAQEARGAVAAGAAGLHVHVRSANGQESLAPDDVASALGAIRAACPGIPVGISTGAWIVPDVSQRLALCNAWEVLPDFASINVHEPGALQMIQLLRDKGMGVEAGIWNAQAAETLVRSGLADACLRILLEPAEEAGDVRANLARIEAALGQVSRPRLLHGAGAVVWELVTLAAQRHYDTRAGFEDTLTLPDGSRAENNAALVAAGLHIVAEVVSRLGTGSQAEH
jgi:uncharacterized protein (DUF849 family)